jgi:chromosome segregation ATPase
MDEKTINELLQQLEQSLKNIEAARKQVEKTVNAYEALKEDVRHYTEELSFIAQNTRTMISQLEEIKEKFLGNISVTIIEEIKAAVRIITEQTNALSSQVSSVYDLVDSRSQAINSNINNRFDSIDSVLGTIQNTINSLSDKTDRVIAKLDTLTSNEDKHFMEIEKKLDAQEKFICRELSIVRKQNIVLFAINALLLLAILVFVLHLVGIV